MLHALYPLLNRRSKLPTRIKILIYKTFVRSVITYGAPTWITMCATQKKRLQSYENKIFRIITNAPWFVRNTVISRDLNQESITTLINKLAKNHFTKMLTHNNLLIRRTNTKKTTEPEIQLPTRRYRHVKTPSGHYH